MFKIDPVIYRFHDKPHWFWVIMISLQYVIKFAVLLSLITLLARSAHVTLYREYNFIALTLIFAAISTLVQIHTRIGAGMIFPAAISVPYYAAILFATQQSGWATALGMTVIASGVQLGLVPCLKRMKFFTFTCLGLILFLISIWLCELGVKQIFYNNQLGQLIIQAKMATLPLSPKNDPYQVIVSMVTLLYIFLAWFSKRPVLRMTSIFVGIVVGYLLLLPKMHHSPLIPLVAQAPGFQWPTFRLMHLAFNMHLLPYFLLAAVMAAMEVVALISVYEILDQQKMIQHLAFHRANRCNIAASLVNLLTVMLGGPPTSIVPGAVSNGFITGVLSKRVAYLYALWLVLFALSPKAIFLLLTLPAALNGVTLIVLGVAILRYALFIIWQESYYSSKSSSSMETKLLGLALASGCATLLMPSHYLSSQFYFYGTTNPALAVGALIYMVFYLCLIIPNRWRR